MSSRNWRCTWLCAFTRRELTAIIVTLSLLFLVLASTTIRGGRRAKRMQCASNLCALGLSFKAWALDHGDHFPMELDARPSANPPLEYFQTLSNSLADPRVLVCPADIRKPAASFMGGFSRSNLSYFVGLDARHSFPNMLLLGDRNLTNGPLPSNRILVLNSNFPVSWTAEMHRFQGNIGLADGSVQQFSSASLSLIVQSNRLAIP